MVATCNYAQGESIFTNENYNEALHNAPDNYAATYYEDEARTIDRLNQDILAIASSSDNGDFDIFICYKHSAIDNPNLRTEDYDHAKDVYTQLKDMGYKVFFAPETMNKEAGRRYEPFIYNALRTAKIMLVICTRKEHVEWAWVLNEWRRYLRIMEKDYDRYLIPCCHGMNATELPFELEQMQSFDINGEFKIYRYALKGTASVRPYG